MTELGGIALEGIRRNQARKTIDVIFKFTRLPALVLDQPSFLQLPKKKRAESIQNLTRRKKGSEDSADEQERYIKALYFEYVLSDGKASSPVRWEIPAACTLAFADIIIRIDQEVKYLKSLPSSTAKAVTEPSNSVQTIQNDLDSFSKWLLHGDDGSKFHGLLGMLEYGLPPSTSAHKVDSPMAQLASWSSKILSGAISPGEWVKSGKKLLINLVIAELCHFNIDFNVSPLLSFLISLLRCLNIIITFPGIISAL